MIETNGSRRAFVGAAIAGAALVGPAAFLLRGARKAAAGGDAITVVPGRVAAAPATVATASAEIAAAAQVIGQPVSLSALEGTAIGEVLAITPIPFAGTRPRTVRAVPFAADFSFPLAGAPEGNRIYQISRPIAGLSELFMMRGDDRGGRAILTAIFE